MEMTWRASAAQGDRAAQALRRTGAGEAPG